jgi:predicted Fe-Mo cluster-binding NifX family protein
MEQFTDERGNKTMKIGVPSMGNRGLEESVGEHFGRVPTYTIVDLETNEIKTVENTSHHMGGQGDPPEILKSEGVSALVCRGLGRRAIDLFEELGIEVYIGAQGTVAEAIESFKKGTLRKATSGDGCQQHAFRSHHH